MAAKPIPSPETLRQLIAYDSSTGVARWRERDPAYFGNGRYGQAATAAAWNRRCAGKVIGNPTPNGYLSVGIFNRAYTLHRVLWAIYHGEWPSQFIDHINHNRKDNRICNLRAVSRSENMQNQSLRSSNRFGCPGITKTRSGRYVAQSNKGGRTRHLGTCETLEEAVLLRRKWEEENGYHENHGR